MYGPDWVVEKYEVNWHWTSGLRKTAESKQVPHLSCLRASLASGDALFALCCSSANRCRTKLPLSVTNRATVLLSA